ncbi:MAG: Txe/YoeB family addiction module toxin [Synergistaceae bacterium]|jgi:toxin YoeB|nr:Txe/YoeB family addiction module toxin [Synergistaceae bacterium]
MRKTWSDDAWVDYLFWQGQDKKTLKKINRLIQDIERNRYDSIGKPEPLKEALAGWWSVKIDEKNRIVFKISGEGDGQILEISQCGSHYHDR